MERSRRSRGYLDAMVSNEDVARGQARSRDLPQGDGRRSASTPEETLVVEDNENGIAAATAAGAHVLVVEEPERRHARRDPRRGSRGRARRGGGGVRLLVLMAGDSDAVRGGRVTATRRTSWRSTASRWSQRVDRGPLRRWSSARAVRSSSCREDEDRPLSHRRRDPPARARAPTVARRPRARVAARRAPRCTRSRTSAATSRCSCFNGDQVARRRPRRASSPASRPPASTAASIDVRRRASALVLRARATTTGSCIEAAEKRPISRLATAGTYWYRRGGDFLDAVDEHDPQGRVGRGRASTSARRSTR